MNKSEINIISQIIRERRSVFPKQFSGEQIRKDVMEEILENANWAPTHKLTEPWRFTVFTGEGLKKLADFMSGLYKEVSMRNGTFDENKFRKLQKKPLMSSHIVSIGMKRDPAARLPEVEEIEAVACAVQNMHLTASALGVGCYWGTGGITYFEEAKPFFELGANDRLLGFMFFGIPAAIPQLGKRKPIREKVRWVE